MLGSRHPGDKTTRRNGITSVQRNRRLRADPGSSALLTYVKFLKYLFNSFACYSMAVYAYVSFSSAGWHSCGAFRH